MMEKKQFAWLGKGIAVLLAILAVYFMARDYVSRRPGNTVELTLPQYEYGSGRSAISYEQWLGSGTYTISFRYTAQGEGSYLSIQNLLAADENNQAGIEYARVELPPTEEEAARQIDITLDKPCYRFVVNVVCEGDRLEIMDLQRTRVDLPYADAALLTIYGVALAALIYWFIHKKKTTPAEQGIDSSQTLPPSGTVVFLVALAVVASWPALTEFMVASYDLCVHLTRIDGIAMGLRQGWLPVRLNYAGVNGAGYASSMMYPDLLLYIPALLRVCGVSLVLAYHSYVVLINLLTAFITYYAVKRMTHSQLSGLLFSTVYTLALYRLVNVYAFHRGAVGEFTAMAFLPLVVAGVHELLCEDEKNIGMLVLGVTGILQSHILTVEMAALFFLFVFIRYWKRLILEKRIIAFVRAGLWVLLLNLWFLVPFLNLMRSGLNASNQGGYADQALYLTQLFSSFVSADRASFGLESGTAEDMALSIGLLLGVGLLLWLFVRGFCLPTADREEQHLGRLGWTFWVLAAVALWMTSIYFPFTWLEKLPLFGKALMAIQFPWRFLGIASVFAAGVMTLALHFLLKGKETRTKRIALAMVFMVAVLNVAPFMDSCMWTKEGAYLMSPDEWFSHDMDSLYWREGQAGNFVCNRPTVLVPTSELQISDYSLDGRFCTFSFDGNAQDTTVTVPYYWYDNYKAVLDDGTVLEAGPSAEGLVNVLLPTSVASGHVKVWFVGRWFYRVGDAVSLLALAVLAVLAVRRRRKPPKRKT